MAAPPISSGRSTQSGIWRTLSPGVALDSAPAWLDSLLKTRRDEDADGLALYAILEKSSSTELVVAAQRARVQAMLDSGQDSRALIEAKSYYNVAAMSHRAEAADLLGSILDKVKGPAVAQQFQSRQETEGLPNQNPLGSIKIDFSIGKGALSKRTGSTTALFLNSIAAGNLFLVGDDAAEARNYFEQAGVHADDARDTQQALSLAIERIASSMRAQDGTPLRAIEFIRNLQADGSLPPELAALGAAWKKADLREAALGVSMDPHQPNQPMFTAGGAIPETAVFTIPGETPLLLARLAPQSDSDLRAWLENWRQENAAGKGVDAAQREKLRQIVAHTRLDTSTVSAMGDVFRDLANDPVTAVEFYRPVLARGDEGNLGPWLQQWLSDVALGKSVDESEQAELEKLLENSKLSCERIYEIGHAFYKVSGDSCTAAIFLASAITHGDSELKGFSQFDDSTRPILQTMKDCEYILWLAHDQGDQNHIRSIDLLCRDLDQWIPEGDPSLGWAKGWAKIGLAECLYEEGKPLESLALTAAINPKTLNDEQKAGLDWIVGIAMFSASNYSDAAQIFRRVIDNINSKHQDEANRMLIQSLYRTGDLAGANQALDEWIKRFHPATTEVASALAILDGAGNLSWPVSGR